MSKQQENNKVSLRQRFASEKPQLIAHAEYVDTKTAPLVKAYFNGEVLSHAGDVKSKVSECENVQSPRLTAILAADRGFSPISKEASCESIHLDQTKINRMNASVKAKSSSIEM